MKTPLHTLVALLLGVGLALGRANGGENKKVPDENATEAEFQAYFGSMTEQPTTPEEIRKLDLAVRAYARLLAAKERELHPPLIELNGDEEEITAQIPWMQARARASNTGKLPDILPTDVVMVTSEGERTAQCVGDTVFVFGNRIRVEDLHMLLQWRIDANHTGKPGPMSVDVDDLCFAAMVTLREARDPTSIPVLKQLLTDQSEVVRRWAGIVLKEILGPHKSDARKQDEGSNKRP